MGCDIHIHLEYKLKNNNGDFNSWTVSPLRIDANYEMFALMADVRNEDGEFIPVAKPRGIPFDASYLTKVHYRNERNDAHSMSWLSSREFGEVLQRYSDDDLCPRLSGVVWSYAGIGRTGVFRCKNCVLVRLLTKDYDTTCRIALTANVRQLVPAPIPHRRQTPVRRPERRRTEPNGSRDNESRGRNRRRRRPYPANRARRLQRPMYRNEDHRPTFCPIGRTNRMAFTRNHERKQTRRLSDVRGIPVGNSLVHGASGE